jgi:hypothetical protein
MSSMDHPHTIGRKVETRLRGKIEYGEVIDEIWFAHKPKTSPKEYSKGVQKVRFDSDGRLEHRFCYYERDKGKKSWHWGQYATFFPVVLSQGLITAMKRHHWIRPM